MELTPIQERNALAWIDGAMFALEQARKALMQELCAVDPVRVTSDGREILPGDQGYEYAAQRASRLPITAAYLEVAGIDQVAHSVPRVKTTLLSKKYQPEKSPCVSCRYSSCGPYWFHLPTRLVVCFRCLPDPWVGGKEFAETNLGE